MALPAGTMDVTDFAATGGDDAFPGVRLARAAGASDGTAPAVFNTDDEDCVVVFPAGGLPFLKIADTLGRVHDGHDPTADEVAPEAAQRSEIRLSRQVRFAGDPHATAATAAELGEAGAELVIVYLVPTYSPAGLEPLMEALAQPA